MATAALELRFGATDAGLTNAAAAASLNLANAVIAGAAGEPWARVDAGDARGDLILWPCGTELWGAASVPVEPATLADATRSVYRQLFQATAELNLHRIWNYIPRVNASFGAGDVYQAFCRGRALAIGERPGGDGARMPAASALGTPGERLGVLFVAGRDPVRHVENPRQVPAHRYPPRYGAHPPTFARGSVVSRADGARRLYLSGTASIRHSESLHTGDVAAQLGVALENADLVASAAGLPGGLGVDSPGIRRLRLYLRDPADWDAVRPLLEQRLRRSEESLRRSEESLRRSEESLRRTDDSLSVVQAEVCRPELLVEIEACVDVPAPR